MGSTPPSIDAHTLAAYIAGTLDDERRRAVTEHLARHPGDREWLHMALEARAAAQHEADAASVSAPQLPPADTAATERSKPSAAPARPARRNRRRHWLLGAVATVVLLAGLSIVLVPPSDTIRTTVAEDVPLAVTVEADPLAVRWEPVPDAYSYRIVVWDPAAAVLVAEHTTDEPHLAADDAFLVELQPRLSSGGTYEVRIDAIDVRNRLLRSSEATAFVAPGT